MWQSNRMTSQKNGFLEVSTLKVNNVKLVFYSFLIIWNLPILETFWPYLVFMVKLTNPLEFLMHLHFMYHFLMCFTWFFFQFTFSYPCMVKKSIVWSQIFKIEILIIYRFWDLLNLKIPFLVVGLWMYVSITSIIPKKIVTETRNLIVYVSIICR